ALSSSTINGAVTLMANSTIKAQAGVLTINGVIGDGFFTYALTKIGPAELRLNGVNVYKGGTTISDGTLSVAADSALGAGPVTLTAGKLLYAASTTTSRSFSLNFGRLQAGAGANVALSGAHLSGGFLAGPGIFTTAANSVLTGTTSLPGAALAVTGATSLVSFT